jgi:hypothetical protein
MLLCKIRELPTILDTGSTRTHESVFRSYQTVEKVIELLKAGCPHEIILEIIEDIRHAPHTEKVLEAQ